MLPLYSSRGFWKQLPPSGLRPRFQVRCYEIDHENTESPVNGETDERFLTSLDGRIARFTIPVQRARIEKITSGNSVAFLETVDVRSKELTTDEETLSRLDQLMEGPDLKKTHLATMIRNYLSTHEETSFLQTEDNALRDW
jgi:hypothetical protein